MTTTYYNELHCTNMDLFVENGQLIDFDRHIPKMADEEDVDRAKRLAWGCTHAYLDDRFDNSGTTIRFCAEGGNAAIYVENLFEKVDQYSPYIFHSAGPLPEAKLITVRRSTSGITFFHKSPVFAKGVSVWERKKWFDLAHHNENPCKYGFLPGFVGYHHVLKTISTELESKGFFAQWGIVDHPSRPKLSYYFELDGMTYGVGVYEKQIDSRKVFDEVMKTYSLNRTGRIQSVRAGAGMAIARYIDVHNDQKSQWYYSCTEGPEPYIDDGYLPVIHINHEKVSYIVYAVKEGADLGDIVNLGNGIEKMLSDLGQTTLSIIAPKELDNG